jgi:lantibiotic modifying enzyme
MRLGAVALTEIEASMDATDGHRGGAAGTAGVAHGLMGQALAFDRLHAVTGDPRFAAAADAALHRADAALRDGPAAVGPLIHSWCQGEVGVATVALTARQRCSSESWQARVAATIESVRTAAPFVDHSVCCGRGGAVELLLLAGDHSGARAIAGSLAATADGDWRISSRPGVAPLLLGFHRGLAGVGYAMLRAMEPSRFPAVLTWR